MMEHTARTGVNSERESKKAEMLRDHAPHPEDLIIDIEESEHIEPGRWRFTLSQGWYEDVLNGLYMEGYRIRRIRGDEAEDPDAVVVDVIEDRYLEVGTCPACGELNEPDYSGDSTSCPDCGAEW